MCGRVPTDREKRIIRDSDAASLHRMSVLHEEHQLSAEQRRALKLLANAGEQGCTGANLLNHRFSVGLFADLVSLGLATGTAKP
jgi:hypothetical protein